MFSANYLLKSKTVLVSVSPYLRVVFIFFRNLSSHACVLMAQIPETTWFIKERRWSVTSAVRLRRAAPTKENKKKYGTRVHRKMTPMRACQPIKYTSNSEDNTTSTTVKLPEKNNLIASSSNL